MCTMIYVKEAFNLSYIHQDILLSLITTSSWNGIIKIILAWSSWKLLDCMIIMQFLEFDDSFLIIIVCVWKVGDIISYYACTYNIGYVYDYLLWSLLEAVCFKFVKKRCTKIHQLLLHQPHNNSTYEKNIWMLV